MDTFLIKRKNENFGDDIRNVRPSMPQERLYPDFNNTPPSAPLEDKKNASQKRCDNAKKLEEEVHLLKDKGYWDIEKGRRIRIVVLGSMVSGKTSLIEALLGMENTLPKGDFSFLEPLKIQPQKNIEGTYGNYVLALTKGFMESVMDAPFLWYGKNKEVEGLHTAGEVTDALIVRSGRNNRPNYIAISNLTFKTSKASPIDIVDVPSPCATNVSREWTYLMEPTKQREQVWVFVTIQLNGSKPEADAILGEVCRYYQGRMKELNIVVVLTKADIFFSRGNTKESGNAERMVSEIKKIKKFFIGARIRFAFVQSAVQGNASFTQEERERDEEWTMSFVPEIVREEEGTLFGIEDLRHFLFFELIRTQEASVMQEIYKAATRDHEIKNVTYLLRSNITKGKEVSEEIVGKLDDMDSCMDAWEKKCIYIFFKTAIENTLKTTGERDINTQEGAKDLVAKLVSCIRDRTKEIVTSCCERYEEFLKDSINIYKTTCPGLYDRIISSFNNLKNQIIEVVAHRIRSYISELPPARIVRTNELNTIWHYKKHSDKQETLVLKLIRNTLPFIEKEILDRLNCGFRYGFSHKLKSIIEEEPSEWKGGNESEIREAFAEEEESKRVLESIKDILKHIQGFE